MRSVYLFILGAALGLLVSFGLAGCGGHGSKGPVGNQYLTGCYADADRVVFVDIELPEGYYGLLVETSSPQLGQIAVDSGTYNLGVFEAGEYSLSLELLLRDAPAPRRSSLGPFVPNLDGVIETCDLLVEGDIEIPEDPPEDPGCPPNVVVNLNPEGGISFVIDGCWAACDPIFEIEFLGEVFTVDNGNEPTVIPFDLEPGEYPWTVRLSGGCGNTDLDNGLIVVVGIPEDEEPGDDDLLPPAWGKHKILVCKDGRNKLLPYPAACAMIRQGKATLGACEETKPTPRHKRCK